MEDQNKIEIQTYSLKRIQKVQSIKRMHTNQKENGKKEKNQFLNLSENFKIFIKKTKKKDENMIENTGILLTDKEKNFEDFFKKKKIESKKNLKRNEIITKNNLFFEMNSKISYQSEKLEFNSNFSLNNKLDIKHKDQKIKQKNFFLKQKIQIKNFKKKEIIKLSFPKKEIITNLSESSQIQKQSDNNITIKKKFMNNFTNLFKNSNEFNISELKSFEIKIVYYVLCRKMKKKNYKKDPKEISLKNLENIVKEYNLTRSIKRLEECLKLVYKSFCNLKKNQLYGKQIFKKQNELSFYVYYFNRISCKLNIHIKNFFDPSKNKKQNFKSFGKNYLLLLIKSEIFKNDFVHFLKYEFQNIYMKSIDNKLKVMFLRLLNIYEKKKNYLVEKKMDFNKIELFEECIYEYFIKANQCKISWSMKEIQDSIYKTLGIIIKNS